MKKPIVKAMACALALTMVVSVPMPVSAQSWVKDAYGVRDTESDSNDTETVTTTKRIEVEDGNPVKVIDHQDVGGANDGNQSPIGTTTITTTNTQGLTDSETEVHIIGVTFDTDVLNIEAGEEAEITATVLMSDGTQFSYDPTTDDEGNVVPGTKASLKELLVFTKFRTNADNQDSSAAAVSYAYDATAGGMDLVKRDTLKIRGIHGGSFYIRAALKTDASGEYKYFDTVAVNVKEYAESLTLNNVEGYAKHTYDLNEYLERTPKTSNDAVTFTAFEEKTTTKSGKTTVTEKATNYVKVNADGTMTIKKDIPADKEVFIKAVSEKGVVAEAKVTTKEATPIAKLAVKDSKAVALTFNDWGVTSKDVEVVAYIKNGNATVEDTGNKTTDVITWTVKNPAVATVAVTKENQKKATITAQSVGKTTVTAKATSGKSATFSVTVTADLQVITAIVDGAGNDSSTVYSGQKVQLTAVKDPAQANTKISWEIAGLVGDDGKIDDSKTAVKQAKKIATVNKNGIVSANSKNVEGTVAVTAYFAKKTWNETKGKTETLKENKKVYAEKTYTLTVEKSNLVADKLVLSDTNITGRETYNKDGSLKGDVIYLGKSDDYNAQAQKKDGKNYVAADFDAEILNNMLTWTTSKDKSVSVDGNGVAVAKATGKATITASVVTAANKTLKAKVSVAATQVVTELQTNKTVVNVSLDKNGKIKDYTLKVAKQLPASATKESVRWERVSGSESIQLGTNYNDDFDANKYVSKTLSAKVTFKDPQVGDTATFKVQAANGAYKLVVVNVVNPTTSVEFKDGDSTVKTVSLEVGEVYDKNLNDLVKITSKNPKDKTDITTVAAGTAGYEEVTYSVNKSGIVTIGSDGTIYGVKAGSVKITAVTPSGKKATMTVKVTNPER